MQEEHAAGEPYELRRCFSVVQGGFAAMWRSLNSRKRISAGHKIKFSDGEKTFWTVHDKSYVLWLHKTLVDNYPSRSVCVLLQITQWMTTMTWTVVLC